MLALAYGMTLVLNWALAHSGDLHNGVAARRVVILGGLLLAYTLLLAVPFVPGVEVGLALLAMEGAWIAPFVYLGTVAGLSLAFLAGFHLPYRHLRRVFADLGLGRAAALIAQIEPLSEVERLALLQRLLPRPLARVMLGGRYLLLAALFNLPGNAVLGGGGGIALVAGLSRIFGRRWTVLTIVLAVAPVPLLVWALGMEALI